MKVEAGSTSKQVGDEASKLKQPSKRRSRRKRTKAMKAAVSSRAVCLAARRGTVGGVPRHCRRRTAALSATRRGTVGGAGWRHLAAAAEVLGGGGGV